MDSSAVTTGERHKTSSTLKCPRSVPRTTQHQLIAASGGRCAFPGCNKFLFAHDLTQREGNFSQIAHIRAFQPEGPRGVASDNFDVHEIENLILLCGGCHKLIDDEVDAYPVDTLRAYKQEHERRIFDLTDIGPELRTEVIQLKGLIGGQQVDIPAHDVRIAVAPHYAAGRTGHVIDLTGLRAEGPDLYRLAREQIRRELRIILSGGIDGNRVRHFSIFALAPIPVLVAFGREFGDKLSADLYQRHRDQSWKWKSNGAPVNYRVTALRAGADPKMVGLLLSLSGAISKSSLPTQIDERFSLYEITLDEREPCRDFLSLREDLTAFRRAYQEALGLILRAHEGITSLHLFPAVPAPIAVACGQELLPKVHPDLVVYDNVKGLFRPAITLNSKEDL